MSLTAREMARTREELVANLALTGLTHDEVAVDLGFSRHRLAAALGPGPADPVDVWQLRDHLLQVLRDAGREPVPFSVLTDRARVRAQAWFELRPAPGRSVATERTSAPAPRSTP